MFDKLGEVEAHFEDIEVRLTSPEVAGQPQLFQKLSKEHSSLQPLIKAYREYKQLKSHFDQNVQVIKEESGELVELAVEENKELEGKLAGLEQELKILLLPKDPNDERNSILEIRAGAGGDEAGIFAGDLFRMYSKYAEQHRWRIDILSASHNDVGGMKEIIALIEGDRVYSRLKHESGVHRVQRVPKTETQGRVHTSTVTVAVLPEADEVEVHVDPNDLRIDVFRSSGPGGQSVNTTDSAVRITHIPTGMVVVCRDEKSQHKNKAKAMKVLSSRLLDQKQQEQHAKIAADRQSQVGTGERSEKIRTYNFPQGRVTDHRINVTLHQIDSFMSGDIEPMISQLISYYQAEALRNQAGPGR
ncbi:peptide chain release factor 1 [bacterium]|nr:peptide chain release factor 1 [bacterium]